MIRRGYSRDHRPDCQQMVIALIVNSEGFPFRYETFDGNRADVSTMETILRMVERKYGKARRIRVFDRRIVSEENLEAIRKRGGQYLVGTPRSRMKQFEAELLKDDWMQVRPEVEVKPVAIPQGEETYILCRTAGRKEKEKAIRKRFSTRMEDALQRLEKTIVTGRPAAYWQGGAGRCPLRLLVVAPTPYRKRKSRKLYYRQPAFLPTTDQKSSAKQLLQIYFDRWQIEVNHRDEKDTLGVGQAQLRNVKAVPKQPVLGVAAYSALLLASLIAFGAERGAAYEALPKWRRKAYRPSCLDPITLLRKEMAEHPELPRDLEVKVTEKQLVRAAAA